MESWLTFLGVSVVVIVTPGQDTALTIRNVLGGGRRAGFGTALGVATGQLTWTLAATLGVTAILIASDAAFSVVRVVGGAYLAWLGLQSLVAAIRGSGSAGPSSGAGRSIALTPRRAWRHGLLSSLGNPKLAVFFSTLLPAFVPTGASPLVVMPLLGLAFATMTIVWLTAYSIVVDAVGDRLRAGPLRRALDAIMGTVMIALGGRLALERR